LIHQGATLIISALICRSNWYKRLQEILNFFHYPSQLRAKKVHISVADTLE